MRPLVVPGKVGRAVLISACVQADTAEGLGRHSSGISTERLCLCDGRPMQGLRDVRWCLAHKARHNPKPCTHGHDTPNDAHLLVCGQLRQRHCPSCNVFIQHSQVVLHVSRVCQHLRVVQKPQRMLSSGTHLVRLAVWVSCSQCARSSSASAHVRTVARISATTTL